MDSQGIPTAFASLELEYLFASRSLEYLASVLISKRFRRLARERGPKLCPKVGSGHGGFVRVDIWSANMKLDGREIETARWARHRTASRTRNRIS